jgi:hypothetical protein
VGAPCPSDVALRSPSDLEHDVSLVRNVCHGTASRKRCKGEHPGVVHRRDLPCGWMVDGVAVR